MRKTRLIIQPVRCLNTFGFLLLFVSSPVFADWGMIRPDSAYSQRAIDLEKEDARIMQKEPPAKDVDLSDQNDLKTCKLIEPLQKELNLYPDSGLTYEVRRSQDARRLTHLRRETRVNTRSKERATPRKIRKESSRQILGRTARSAVRSEERRSLNSPRLVRNSENASGRMSGGRLLRTDGIQRRLEIGSRRGDALAREMKNKRMVARSLYREERSEPSLIRERKTTRSLEHQNRQKTIRESILKQDVRRELPARMSGEDVRRFENRGERRQWVGTMTSAQRDYRVKRSDGFISRSRREESRKERRSEAVSGKNNRIVAAGLQLDEESREARKETSIRAAHERNLNNLSRGKATFHKRSDRESRALNQDRHQEGRQVEDQQRERRSAGRATRREVSRAETKRQITLGRNIRGPEEEHRKTIREDLRRDETLRRENSRERKVPIYPAILRNTREIKNSRMSDLVTRKKRSNEVAERLLTAERSSQNGISRKIAREGKNTEMSLMPYLKAVATNSLLGAAALYFTIRKPKKV